MADFTQAVEIVLRHEGGYINHPSDPGGETNYGICKRSYPKEDIKHLTRERAKFIYRRDFWGPICGDHINNQELANSVFDFAVNAGVREAVTALQIVCNTTPDGIMGPVTLGEANKLRGVIGKYLRARIQYYAALVSRRPENMIFFMGWINRAMEFLT